MYVAAYEKNASANGNRKTFMKLGGLRFVERVIMNSDLIMYYLYLRIGASDAFSHRPLNASHPLMRRCDGPAHLAVSLYVWLSS